MARVLVLEKPPYLRQPPFAQGAHRGQPAIRIITCSLLPWKHKYGFASKSRLSEPNINSTATLEMSKLQAQGSSLHGVVLRRRTIGAENLSRMPGSCSRNKAGASVASSRPTLQKIAQVSTAAKLRIGPVLHAALVLAPCLQI